MVVVRIITLCKKFCFFSTSRHFETKGDSCALLMSIFLHWHTLYGCGIPHSSRNFRFINRAVKQKVNKFEEKNSKSWRCVGDNRANNRQHRQYRRWKRYNEFRVVFPIPNRSIDLAKMFVLTPIWPQWNQRHGEQTPKYFPSDRYYIPVYRLRGSKIEQK